MGNVQGLVKPTANTRGLSDARRYQIRLHQLNGIAATAAAGRVFQPVE